MSNPSSSQRLHGLDALRGFALLLGVVLHAGMSFLPGPYGIPIWIVQDTNADAAYSLVFYVPHIFRMVLFFLIAGFFARLAYEKRGAIGFGFDRLKRIALPLLTFWMPVFAAIVTVLIWGAIKANGGEVPEHEDPPLTASNFPLTHLWFLYLLCLFYPVAMALRVLIRLIDRSDRLGRLLDRLTGLVTATPAGIVFLSLPLLAAFMTAENWMMWFGIPTPDTGLFPNAVALAGYGTAFTFGWVLHRRRDLLGRFQAWWPVYLVIAIALTAACLAFNGLAPNFNAPDGSAQSWAYAGSYAMAGWAWSFGLIGLGLSLFSRESRTVRYIADASYWIYIIHLPVVMALQVAFSDLEVVASIKFVAINLITLAACLATYHLLVRGSWIGGWLNGRRYGKRHPAASADTSPSPAE